MIPNNMRRGVFLLIVSISVFSCATLMQLNVFPVSKDIELGQQFDSQIRTTPKQYPILQNHPEVKLFVENIGKKILSSPDILYRDQFAYKFEIIHDDSTVNAFCTPGGYVYVYTGLLKFLDNEASLAAVIAHEMAHAERRHSTNQMTAQYGVQTLLNIASGKLGESGTQVAGALANIGLLKYSRADEEEADTYSFKYLQSTEYFPGASKYFFEKVAKGSNGGALERLLSTHPLAQDRINNINKLIAGAGNPQPKESTVFSARYKKFKQTLP
jgi:beta-barrel assembly-enhancing protease